MKLLSKPLIILFAATAACDTGTDVKKSAISRISIVSELPASPDIRAPRPVPAGKPDVRLAGKPSVIITNRNEHMATAPKVVKLGKPDIVKPGEHGLLRPHVSKALGNRIEAGPPEVVIAREQGTKDQNPESFSYFGKMQGLKSDGILCILEDKVGNLWIGTNGNGVTRYDGKRFSHYTEAEGLGQNFVTSMIEDSQGNIWFGFQSHGIGMYDGRNFVNYTSESGLSDNWVSSLIRDRRGNIWIGTVRGGVNKFDGDEFTHYTRAQGLNSDTINFLLQDRAGKIWAATPRGATTINEDSIAIYSSEQGIASAVNYLIEGSDSSILLATTNGLMKLRGDSLEIYTTEQGLANNYVYSLQRDRQDNLWIGYGKKGMSRFDGRIFKHYGEEQGLADYEVWKMLEDRNGILWIATGGGGVYRFNGLQFSHFTKKEGFDATVVTGATLTNKQNLWVTGWNGVHLFDGSIFKHYTSKNGLPGDLVWCSSQDKDGNIWFGTIDGVSKFDGRTFTNYNTSQGLGNQDVKCVFQDSKGNLWFGATDGVTKFDGETFTYLTEKEGLSQNLIVCLSIIEDSDGNMWFGTGGGISKYDGRNFTNFIIKQGNSRSVVTSVLEDHNRNIWFGTAGNGLFKYDGKTFQQITENDGLSNNHVLALTEDTSHNLWCGTENGVTMINLNRTTIRNYAYEDGLLGVGANSILQTAANTFWICSNDRLTRFTPSAKMENVLPPNIQLTGISLFNENVAWQNVGSTRTNSRYRANFELSNGVQIHDVEFDSLDKWYDVPVNLSLAYDNNHIEFQFAGVTLRTPGKVRYQYILQGLENQWSSPTFRAEASYGSLPFGKYTFKAKAMNEDGTWSKELLYHFVVRPPWWHTWWAYTVFGLSFAVVLYGLFRYRLNKLRTTHKLEMQQHKLAELEMHALRAQMNPHFIFNALNSINLFILENNRNEASQYLSKFSRLVGMILHHSRESFISLDKELEALRLYLDLESLRFEQKFSYSIDVDDSVNVRTAKVPPLIIQPYAENAIWHGLMNKGEDGKLNISIYQDDIFLCCRIKDNGIGRKKAMEFKSRFSSERKSVGMRITSDRLEMLHNDAYTERFVTIHDLVFPNGSAAGTEVLLKIPLQID